MLRGNNKIYHGKLVDDVSTRFGVRSVNKSMDSHITLKAPFSADENLIEKVKESIKLFCKQSKVVELQVNDFGSFGTYALFMKVEPNKPQLLTDLLLKLKEIQNLEFSEYEFENTLHISVAKRDIGDKFNDIQKYLNEQYKPKLNISLDSISLCKKENGGRWEVLEEFKLQN
ncbi:2'-5' RNA ligase family protein [Patescibacteria group bacterium]